jgi:hypothetical protein
MTIPRGNKPEIMAQVLSEVVVELSNPEACRRSLAFAGFNPKQIEKHLTYARIRARHIRLLEIEQLVRKERI